MITDEFHATFTLRQHTPMIHFQADQPGAILRASELKPAFDKYLRERAFANDFDQCKQFLVGFTNDERQQRELRGRFKTSKQEDALAEGECAFNYKVSIKPTLTDTMELNKGEQYPCFLGNMGKKETENEDPSDKHWTLLLARDDFSITFFTLNPTLLAILDQRFPAFISRKNFGTRQSKGFGSFTTVDDNQNSVSALHTAVFMPKNLLSFKVRVGANQEYFEQCRTVFSHIDMFWRIIRNGFDYKGIEAGLGEYVEADNSEQATWRRKADGSSPLNGPIEWDKPTMRTFVNAVVKHYPLPPIANRIMFRDLLGLASYTDWKTQKASLIKEHIEPNEANEIHRFKSPVTFKPVRKSASEFEVFIVLQPIPDEYYNKRFRLSVTPINRSSPLPTTVEFSTAPRFSLTSFFKFVTTDYKKNILGRRLNKSQPEWQLLRQVFDTLTIHTQP